jgi:hypothetical protein
VAKNPIPDDADPVFKEVMKAVRTGKNPTHAAQQRLSDKQQKAVDKALKDAKRKRKGAHRAGGDDVINTGMFD